MINLTEKDLKDLEAFLMDMPFKYASPVLQFLASKMPPKEATEVEVAEA